jgi:hypothetical protein
MLDFLKRLLNNQKPGCEPLDPYLVGRIAGSVAFATGDWVVLRRCENKPAKVRRDPYDFPGAVRVIPGNPSDGMYAETCYCASDLGYPLSKDLWSKSQARWYQKCHEDEYSINLAKSFSAQPQEPKGLNKQFDIEDYLERYSSTFFFIFLYSVTFGLAAAYWGLLTNPQAVAPIIIRIIVIAGLIFFACVVKQI